MKPLQTIVAALALAAGFAGTSGCNTTGTRRDLREADSGRRAIEHTKLDDVVQFDVSFLGTDFSVMPLHDFPPVIRDKLQNLPAQDRTHKIISEPSLYKSTYGRVRLTLFPPYFIRPYAQTYFFSFAPSEHAEAWEEWRENHTVEYRFKQQPTLGIETTLRESSLVTEPDTSENAKKDAVVRSRDYQAKLFFEYTPFTYDLRTRNTHTLLAQTAHGQQFAGGTEWKFRLIYDDNGYGVDVLTIAVGATSGTIKWEEGFGDTHFKGQFVRFYFLNIRF